MDFEKVFTEYTVALNLGDSDSMPLGPISDDVPIARYATALVRFN